MCRIRRLGRSSHVLIPSQMLQQRVRSPRAGIRSRPTGQIIVRKRGGADGSSGGGCAGGRGDGIARLACFVVIFVIVIFIGMGQTFLGGGGAVRSLLVLGGGVGLGVVVVIVVFRGGCWVGGLVAARCGGTGGRRFHLAVRHRRACLMTCFLNSQKIK